MAMPGCKTKIVCTVGPACGSVDVLEAMIRAGMNVARLNFSHGNPGEKIQDLRNIREAARRAGRIVTVLADLPGAKIRLGRLATDPMTLQKGQSIVLTVKESPSSADHIPVDYRELPESVAPGRIIYVNDGFIELRVEAVSDGEVRCTVVTGGLIRSHKGVNLPGSKLFLEPVTARDLEIVEFALQHGIDTFGISFVERPEDVLKVKDFAKSKGKEIFAVAKIEREPAVRNIDAILNVVDGIMVARGDLGVEMPIEEVPAIQKRIIGKANLLGKPVITATQMLESMKNNLRPTRAEVSDVANAILDGTDAVMLSEETAIGNYPVETVQMMASVAAFTEPQRPGITGVQEELRWYLKNLAGQGKLTVTDVISRNVVVDADVLNARYVITPTEGGTTARRVARYKPACWVMAFTTTEATSRFLCFSYGVYPFLIEKDGGNWKEPIFALLKEKGLVKKDDRVIITQGRLLRRPGGTDSLEILTIE